MDKVTIKTVSTNHNLVEEKGEREAVSNQGPDKDCVGVLLHTMEGRRGWEGRGGVQRGGGASGGGVGGVAGGTNTDPMGESHESLGEVQL